VIAVRTTDCFPSITEFIDAASDADTWSTWSSDAPRVGAPRSVAGTVLRSLLISLTRDPFVVRYPGQRSVGAQGASILPHEAAMRETPERTSSDARSVAHPQVGPLLHRPPPGDPDGR
jgi:hypothetical protein